MLTPKSEESQKNIVTLQELNIYNSSSVDWASFKWNWLCRRRALTFKV